MDNVDAARVASQVEDRDGDVAEQIVDCVVTQPYEVVNSICYAPVPVQSVPVFQLSDDYIICCLILADALGLIQIAAVRCYVCPAGFSGGNPL